MIKSKTRRSFLFRYSLSIAFLLLFLISIIGQIITGHAEFNELLKDHNKSEISVGEYFATGHFIEATFENWESEFLQMGVFVLLTIFLMQEGSSESKKFEGKEEVDRNPKAKKDAPWSVRKGGLFLKFYSHSLTIALLLLFVICFSLHLLGSWDFYKFEQALDNKPIETFGSFLTGSRFWFESFQNWQSEFLSVFTLIFLSIYLRQKGSPQSKPVDAPHKETED